MAYISGIDRNQTILFPECLDAYIDGENPVRLFDAFVNSLDMEGCGFARSVPATEGRPGYDPRDMVKLYIYGYFNRIRSSRSLMKETARNVEVMWLVSKLSPDFRTIADFRKDNHQALKAVFKAFNRLCVQLELYSHEYASVDGSKFKAVNAKDNNFSLGKLDDRLERLDGQIADYLRLLEESDVTETDARSFTQAELEERIKSLNERKAVYSGYRDSMEQSGALQMSLTDPESRLMKTHEGFQVAYNVQTAVDAKHHLIAGFEVTNRCADFGLLEQVTAEVKDDFGLATLEAVADKGYRDWEDLANCLLRGTVPNVPPMEGKDGIDLETAYKEAEITESMKQSTQAADIAACMQAGVIPEIYAGIISNIAVAEQPYYEYPEETAASEGAPVPEADMLAKAKEGNFVRDIARNLVYCPEGKLLRPTTVKKNGYVRYANKHACAGCPAKCTKSKYKEADFSPGKTVLASSVLAQGEPLPKPKRIRKTRRVVRFTFNPDRKKLAMRKCLSEHPFGTIKRALGASYLLLKGKAKATGEMALLCMAYNLKRALATCGIGKIMAVLAGQTG